MRHEYHHTFEMLASGDKLVSPDGRMHFIARIEPFVTDGIPQIRLELVDHSSEELVVLEGAANALLRTSKWRKASE